MRINVKKGHGKYYRVFALGISVPFWINIYRAITTGVIDSGRFSGDITFSDDSFWFVTTLVFQAFAALAIIYATFFRIVESNEDDAD